MMHRTFNWKHSTSGPPEKFAYKLGLHGVPRSFAEPTAAFADISHCFPCWQLENYSHSSPISEKGSPISEKGSPISEKIVFVCLLKNKYCFKETPPNQRPRGGRSPLCQPLMATGGPAEVPPRHFGVRTINAYRKKP